MPPVERGVLMLYNMGDLDDMDQNSILSLETTTAYLNTSSSYPLPLALALPQFSQTVIKSSDGGIKLINGEKSQELNANPDCFQKLSEHRYRATCDTTLHSQVVLNGFEIKVDIPDLDEVVAAKEICLSSNLDIDEYILYHLDAENVRTSLITKLLQ